MYIPINVEEGEQLIDLTFYGAPVYWFLFIISFMFFLILLSYLIFDKNPLAKLFKNLRFNTQADEEDY